MTILCLGEAIVDLICPEPAGSIAEATRFEPSFGGALANVALGLRRAGSDAALAGGAGADPWGDWLRRRLSGEGVDLDWFGRVAGLATPVAFATFDEEGEPSFAVYGDGIAAGIRSLEGGRLAEAIATSSALVFGSNTLVGEGERELTLEARSLARDRGLPVCFDPNIREGRWADPAEAIELCRELCDGAFLVRANSEEASRITGRETPEEAAVALCELGATIGVVTRGAGGAVLAGPCGVADDPAPAVQVVSTLGAGDAFMGALVAGLERLAWDPGRAAEALPEAVRAGSAACTHLGAQP